MATKKKEKKKLRILCDLDGIVVDLYGAWLSLYNKEYKDSLTVNDLDQFDMHKNVKPECGSKIYDYLETKDFFFNLKPLPGAVAALRKIAKVHEVVILTAAVSYPESAADKIRWIAKYLPFINRKDVIVCTKKYYVYGDILIDDKSGNIISQKAHWPKTKIYTIAYPYNNDVKRLCKVRADDCTNTKTAWQQILNELGIE